MTDYIDIISRKYPGTQCSVIGDPSIYTNITWSGASVTQANLDAAALTCAKEDVKDKINVYRYAWSKVYFTWNTDQWQCDDISRTNLVGANTLSLLNGGNLPAGFTWRDYNNIDVVMTGAQMGALGAQMMKFATGCYQVSWAHKSNVDALTDITLVNSYDYTTSWPSKDVQL